MVYGILRYTRIFNVQLIKYHDNTIIQWHRTYPVRVQTHFPLPAYEKKNDQRCKDVFGEALIRVLQPVRLQKLPQARIDVQEVYLKRHRPWKQPGYKGRNTWYGSELQWCPSLVSDSEEGELHQIDDRCFKLVFVGDKVQKSSCFLVNDDFRSAPTLNVSNLLGLCAVQSISAVKLLPSDRWAQALSIRENSSCTLLG